MILPMQTAGACSGDRRSTELLERSLVSWRRSFGGRNRDRRIPPAPFRTCFGDGRFLRQCRLGSLSDHLSVLRLVCHYGYAALLVLAAIAFYGFRTSLAGRRVLENLPASRDVDRIGHGK